MQKNQQVFSLSGTIQHYDWGGFDYIPRMLHISNPERQPFAELWMGAHPSAPATVQNNGNTTTLDKLVEKAPAQLLGDKVASKFQDRLPYLFKVLDVRKMLSIQAHPTKQQAEEGFRRENEQGIPLNAPNRTYKDDNHKPEVMVALSDFWLLHGFKSSKDILSIIEQVPAFAPLRNLAAQENIYDLYKYIMEMPQAVTDGMLQPLEQALAKQNPDQHSADYWAKQAFQDHPARDGHYDRGIFSIYLLNLVHLQTGEGIFQAAGIPHAYLEGVNVELMANSDNVFRGGLTSKHVDVPELLKSLVFKEVSPHIILGKKISDTEEVYRTPAPDFELSRIVINKNELHRASNIPSPHTLIVIEGEIVVNDELTFGRGGIFFARAGANYTIRSNEHATLFKASVP